MDIIIEDNIPSVTKVVKDNPFTAHFPTSEGKSLGIIVNGTDEERDKAIKIIKRDARAAAIAIDKTARIAVAPALDAKGKKVKNSEKVNIWTVTRVLRPRKPAAETPAETTAEKV